MELIYTTFPSIIFYHKKKTLLWYSQKGSKISQTFKVEWAGLFRILHFRILKQEHSKWGYNFLLVLLCRLWKNLTKWLLLLLNSYLAYTHRHTFHWRTKESWLRSPRPLHSKQFFKLPSLLANWNFMPLVTYQL